MLRRRDDELMAQVREVLGADRFEEVFTAGSRLNQRDAVAAVGDTHRAGAAAS
jgi:hypothetical protein